MSFASKHHQKSRLWLYAILILGVIAITVGGFYARPIWNAYEASKARKLVVEGEKYLSEGKIQEAIQIARRVYELSPETLEVLRFWGKITARFNPKSNEANYFWRKVTSHEDSVPEDWMEYASVLIRNGNFVEAERILNSLPPSMTSSSRGLEIMAMLYQARGEISRAETTLRQAVSTESFDEDAESILRKSMIQIKDTFVEVRQEGIKNLWKLAQEDTPVGLRALEVLSSLPNLTPNDLQNLIDLFAKNSKAQPSHYYLARDIQIRLRPETKPQIIDEEFKNNGNKQLHELVEFFAWLTRQGESGLITNLLKPETALESPEIIKFYLNALAQEGKWSELLTILNGSKRLPLRSGQIELLKANCLHETGANQSEVEELLRKAINHAKNEADEATLLNSNVFARNANMNELGYLALETMVQTPEWKERALQTILKFARQDEDMPRMKESLQRLTEAFPANERYPRQLTYLNLLDGTHLEIALNQAQHAFTISPETTECKFLFYFAKFRFGDSNGLLQDLRAMSTNDLQPGQRAVLAFMFDILGDTAQAISLVEKVPVDLLIPAEKRLIDTILR